MSKTRLEFDYDYDFLLFGISCHLKDYRLCWSLNRHMSWSLKREEDLEIAQSAEGENSRFSLYSWEDTSNHLRYFVVANRGTPGLLIQEERQFDFFLLIEGYIDLVESGSVLGEVRQAGGILTAKELDPNALKSKQNLIFE